MTEERKALIDAMAVAKSDAPGLFDRVVNAILALAWEYRDADFRWEDHPDLDEKVNELLRGLSDGLANAARERARELLTLLGLEELEEESIEYAEREIDGEDAIFRLDMQASHLKELLAGWLVVAAMASLSITQTRSLIYSYLNSPSASPEWRGAGLSKPGWGTGYAVNVLNGVAVIMQDMINASYQYAKQKQFAEDGAVGYRIERGSDYDCPLCDSYVGPVYPVGEMILPIHPRCVCIPVPVYENEQ